MLAAVLLRKPCNQIGNKLMSSVPKSAPATRRGPALATKRAPVLTSIPTCCSFIPQWYQRWKFCYWYCQEYLLDSAFPQHHYWESWRHVSQHSRPWLSHILHLQNSWSPESLWTVLQLLSIICGCPHATYAWRWNFPTNLFWWALICLKGTAAIVTDRLKKTGSEW